MVTLATYVKSKVEVAKDKIDTMGLRKYCSVLSLRHFIGVTKLYYAYPSLPTYRERCASLNQLAITVNYLLDFEKCSADILSAKAI